MFTLLFPRSSQANPLHPALPPPIIAAMRELPILTEATVLRILKPGVFDVRLPNGKVSCAHLSKDLETAELQPACGCTVRVELTPFDFDTARIAAVIGPDPGK